MIEVLCTVGIIVMVAGTAFAIFVMAKADYGKYKAKKGR
jgi:hypothetical protein